LPAYLSEIDLIYGSACDGIRLESHQRALIRLVAQASNREDLKFGLHEEREIQLAASLMMNWRHIGLQAELDSYSSNGASRRPDFGIGLPTSNKYLFLELKVIWPGSNKDQVLDDLKKIQTMYESGDLAVGLMTVGYAQPNTNLKIFNKRHHDMSRQILATSEFDEIGMKKSISAT